MRAVLIVESQPPNISEVVALFSLVNKYEHVILCVQNNPIVISVGQVMSIWQLLIEPVEDKVTLTFGDKEFKSIAKIPKEYEDCHLLTVAPDIYTHLQSLGVEAGLLPRLQGYEPTFLQVAYKQSKALQWIYTHTNKQTMR